MWGQATRRLKGPRITPASFHFECPQETGVGSGNRGALRALLFRVTANHSSSLHFPPRPFHLHLRIASSYLWHGQSSSLGGSLFDTAMLSEPIQCHPFLSSASFQACSLHDWSRTLPTETHV